MLDENILSWIYPKCTLRVDDMSTANAVACQKKELPVRLNLDLLPLCGRAQYLAPKST